MAAKKSKSKSTEADPKLNQPDPAAEAQDTTAEEPAPTTTSTSASTSAAGEVLEEGTEEFEEHEDVLDDRPVRVRISRTIRRTNEEIDEIVEQYNAPPLMDSTRSEYPVPVG